jgi:hypothetical protein
MQDPANRFVVIISALLTLLVLGGATLAVWFRNGWLHVATDAPSRDAVTALAQLTDAERSRTLPTAREANPSPALEAGADQSEVVVYREKLEEAYRALDDAYAQIRSLQTAQPQLASRGDGDRRFTDHGDDDHRERGSRRREADDD